MLATVALILVRRGTERVRLILLGKLLLLARKSSRHMALKSCLPASKAALTQAMISSIVFSDA